MSNKLQTTLIIGFIACLWACGGEKKTTESKQPTVVAKAEEAVDPVLKKGETVYKSYCMACHMSKGEGVPNLNPPLTKTKYTMGDEETLIKIVINGLDEEIEVLGQKYSNVMTPFNFLSDEEIASVLTYVRQNFGNDASAITIEKVAEVRASLGQ